MSRPPCRSPAATRSIARATCGKARRTAGATTASSALIRLAISSADLRSRSSAPGWDCSVRKPRRSPAGLCVLLFKNVLSTSRVQGLKHCVVKSWPDLFDCLIRAIGPGPVRQQDYRKLPRGVDPQRGSCVAQVAEGLRRKIFPRLRGRGWSIPSQRARGASGRAFTPREESERFRAEDRRFTAQHGVRKASEILSSREDSCLWGHPAKHAGVLVLYLALDDALPERAIVLRGRDVGATFGRGIVSGVRHAQRAEDLALA